MIQGIANKVEIKNTVHARNIIMDEWLLFIRNSGETRKDGCGRLSLARIVARQPNRANLRCSALNYCTYVFN